MRLPVIFFSILVFTQVFAPKALAQTMQQSNYQLDFQSFSEEEEVAPSKPTSIPQKLPQNTNFDYEKYSLKNLGVSISPDVLDFGIITATTPVKRAIKISNASTGLVLYAYSNHSLINENGDVIPETSCDEGTCSDLIAGIWENTLSFGLGYSCSGEQCDSDFDKNRFRSFSTSPSSFAEFSGNKTPGLSMPVVLNTSTTQAPGNYQNSITILAVPKL